MVTLADRQYTLEDFNRVIYIGNIPPLPLAIINKIKHLAQKVGAPSYNKTPNFKKNRRNRVKYGSENWENIRNFTTTKIERATKGIGKYIDDIILLLNKITESNYKEMCASIIKIMEKVDNEDEDGLLKLGESIFLIGSSNDFYSQLYSRLYKDLIEKYFFMKAICTKNFNNFHSLFENIEYVKAEEDYDKFCEINKDNEKRRALGGFFVRLMLHKIIDIEMVFELINNLIDKHIQYLEDEGKKNIIDEISENIYIIITLGAPSFKKSTQWDKIINYINKISESKSSSFPGLTNKTIFKFMDILETI